MKMDLKSLPNKGNLSHPDCPAREIMDSLTGLWGALVLRALQKGGVVRFAELKKEIGGISEKMLSQTLKRLERYGFIERKSYPEIPPRVEYRLSKVGKDCSEMITDLCSYLENNVKTLVKNQIEYDKRDQVRPWQKPRR